MHESDGNINNARNNKTATTVKNVNDGKHGIGASSVHSSPQTYVKGRVTTIYGGTVDSTTLKVSRAAKFRHQCCTFAPRNLASGSAADMINNIEFVLTCLWTQSNLEQFLYIDHLTDSRLSWKFGCFLLRFQIRILYYKILVDGLSELNDTAYARNITNDNKINQYQHIVNVIGTEYLHCVSVCVAEIKLHLCSTHLHKKTLDLLRSKLLPLLVDATVQYNSFNNTLTALINDDPIDTNLKNTYQSVLDNFYDVIDILKDLESLFPRFKRNVTRFTDAGGG